MGPDRLLSLAIHATRERRALDHPPPTASRSKGQKVMPALVHCEAVSRNAFFRDSTEAKIPEIEVGSGMTGPNLKALVMEKSHASCPPLEHRGTQTSAGRRETLAESERAIFINGVTGDEKARFLQNCGEVGSVISSRVDDVPNEVMT